MAALSRTSFLRLAEQALREIPRPFLDLLYNLAIDVKASPGSEAGRWKGSKTLLGLYTGLSRADMLGPFSPAAPPSRIVLYQKNIQRGCAGRAELKLKIRLTLRHELAHHFGFSDEDLQKKWPEGA